MELNRVGQAQQQGGKADAMAVANAATATFDFVVAPSAVGVVFWRLVKSGAGDAVRLRASGRDGEHLP